MFDVLADAPPQRVGVSARVQRYDGSLPSSARTIAARRMSISARCGRRVDAALGIRRSSLMGYESLLFVATPSELGEAFPGWKSAIFPPRVEQRENPFAGAPGKTPLDHSIDRGRCKAAGLRDG